MGCNDNVRTVVHSVDDVRRHARNMRVSIIEMLAAAGSGHSAGALGLADIVASLLFGGSMIVPGSPVSQGNDLLVLSNGHVCPVLYAGFYELGLIDRTEMLSLRQMSSRLQGHPERIVLPLVETTSGPLGEGLSQACGMAYAAKILDHDERQIFCILGDGELDEGQCWEAIMFAHKYRLGNLTAIIDVNNIQLSGTTSDVMPLDRLAKRWQSFGWRVEQLSGDAAHDPADIIPLLKSSRHTDRPTVILAQTTPGKGISFMENDYRWHGKAPSAEQAERAIKELTGGGDV